MPPIVAPATIPGGPPVAKPIAPPVTKPIACELIFCDADLRISITVRLAPSSKYALDGSSQLTDALYCSIEFTTPSAGIPAADNA